MGRGWERICEEPTLARARWRPGRNGRELGKFSSEGGKGWEGWAVYHEYTRDIPCKYLRVSLGQGEEGEWPDRPLHGFPGPRLPVPGTTNVDFTGASLGGRRRWGSCRLRADIKL